MADETQSPALAPSLTASNTVASLAPQPVAAVESEVKTEFDKIETAVVADAKAVVAEVKKEVAKVAPEAKKIETEVVAVAEKVYEEAKEGLVAAENVARKVLNHHISAGGGSRIVNPA